MKQQDNEPRPHSSYELRSAITERMHDDVRSYGKILDILSRADRHIYLLECEVTALAHQLRVKSEELRVVRGQLREASQQLPPEESGLWDRLTS